MRIELDDGSAIGPVDAPASLRTWVTNVETRWDDAVGEVGAACAGIWRQMTGLALRFEAGPLHVHHLSASKADGGRSSLPLELGTWA